MRIVAFFAPVLSALLLVGGANSQDKLLGALPKVLQHAAPIYPPLARQTRISGEVRLKLRTDGEAVRDVEVESGHPLLRQAAMDNVKTWKFAPHEAGTFEVTFRYKLSGETESLECPGIVTLEASPPELIIDYATIDLGTWNAEFNGANGKAFGTLKLDCSGPKGEWLGAYFKMDKARTIESDYGYKEGDFLTFAMKLKRADGKRVKTFFIGKKTKDHIVGTFVDDGGATGEWTAERVHR